MKTTGHGASKPADGIGNLIALLKQALAEVKDGRLVGIAMISIIQSAPECFDIKVDVRGGPTALLAGSTLQLQEQLRQAMFPKLVAMSGSNEAQTRKAKKVSNHNRRRD